VTGGGASSNTSTITGGGGGDGGASGGSAGDIGGNGGDGGVGVWLNAAGATFTNSGTVTGGVGGAEGAAVGGGSPGMVGVGGVGIFGFGSGLTVINSGTITGGLSGDGSTQANAIMFTGGTNVLELQFGSIISGNVVGTGLDIFRLGGATDSSFDVTTLGPTGQYQGFSTYEKTGTSTWTLTGAATAPTPWTISDGTLAISDGNSLGVGSVLTMDGGTLQIVDGNAVTTNRAIVLDAGGGTFLTGTVGTSAILSGIISGAGSFTKSGPGTVTLSGANTYIGATVVDDGTLRAGAINTFSSASAFTINAGGVLDLNGFNQTIDSISGAGDITLGSAFLTTGGVSTSATFSGTMSGTGRLTKEGTGTFTLSGATTYTGATSVNAGTLQAGAMNAFSSDSAFTVATGAIIDLDSFDQSIGSLAGAGDVTLGTATLTTGNDNTNTTFSGGISDTGGLTKIGTGIFTLSGTSGYTGATSVDAGTLLVNGSIAGSAVTVNAGATLGGTGTVGPTTIASGGTLAPGNSIGTITVSGALALNSGSTYAVEVSPSSADKTVVTGAASLAGTAQATFQPGSYMPKQYTIVTSAGLGGTTFDTFAASGVPSGFDASLSYTATDALLNLAAALGKNQGLNGNQQNVANAINGFFNGGGTLPPNFLSIFGLTGGSLQDALSLLSGEAATGAEQSAFRMTGQFLGLMMDPYVDWTNGNSFGGRAIGFAPEQARLIPPDAASAFASARRRSPGPDSPFERRWGIWSTGFGGTGNTSGDAAIGSHDTKASTYGIAVGLDYRLSPDAVVGWAVSGGGTDWSLASGLGSGSGNVFQFGVYGAVRSGQAYIATSAGLANHWVSTNRNGPAGERIAGSFSGQGLGLRLEGGYRFGDAFGGITPYAAGQAQTFRAPAYSEDDLSASGFALSYNARTANHVRSELGARFDQGKLFDSGSRLTLRSRLAWAHDWLRDPSLRATFQPLPGATFVVNGAAPTRDAALTSAGFELSLASGITLLAKVDGEFAANTQTYSGSGSLRYRW
jgi:autotransporter-associated beta strand protein